MRLAKPSEPSNPPKSSLKPATPSSKPISSYSTIRYYDNEDSRNNSQLMAKRFRSTSILRKYQKICNRTTSRNITKTLLGLQKQKIAAKNMQGRIDHTYFNNIRGCKTHREGMLDGISKDSKFTLGLTQTSESTKKTESRLDYPTSALKRNMTNYPGIFFNNF